MRSGNSDFSRNIDRHYDLFQYPVDRRSTVPVRYVLGRQQNPGFTRPPFYLHPVDKDGRSLAMSGSEGQRLEDKGETDGQSMDQMLLSFLSFFLWGGGGEGSTLDPLGSVVFHQPVFSGVLL